MAPSQKQQTAIMNWVLIALACAFAVAVFVWASYFFRRSPADGDAHRTAEHQRITKRIEQAEATRDAIEERTTGRESVIDALDQGIEADRRHLRALSGEDTSSLDAESVRLEFERMFGKRGGRDKRK